LTNTALLVIGLAIFAAGIAFRLADVRFAVVLSNSMQPTFSAGDLVVTRPVAVAALQAGDVIAFLPPGSTRPLMHRIAAIADGVMTTRGDANPVSDPWQLHLAGPTANRLVAVVPYVGWLTELQRPALLLAGALLGLLIVLELGKEVGKRLGRHRTQPQA
jgi:signal peptidase I